MSTTTRLALGFVLKLVFWDIQARCASECVRELRVFEQLTRGHTRDVGRRRAYMTFKTKPRLDALTPCDYIGFAMRVQFLSWP